jgi:hypothetical protein
MVIDFIDVRDVSFIVRTKRLQKGMWSRPKTGDLFRADCLGLLDPVFLSAELAHLQCVVEEDHDGVKEKVGPLTVMVAFEPHKVLVSSICSMQLL